MEHDRTPARRVFRDRLGRVITDPETIEARALLSTLRRCITRGVKAGKPWDDAVTVGELAVAAKLTPERVVQIIRQYDAWLWGLATDDGPMAGWGVFEDGE